MIEQETGAGAGAGAGERLENWTKWPLHLLQHDGQRLVVQPSTQLAIANMVITCPLLTDSIHFLPFSTQFLVS